MTDNTKSGYSTISIPKPLAEKLKKRCEGTGFNSVSSYVTYVLRQLVSTIEKKETPTEEQPAEKEAFSKEDEEKVKERLKALGYID
jgi:Arc/MetJ-type ribon-helix-helix transcriptional regulator